MANAHKVQTMNYTIGQIHKIVHIQTKWIIVQKQKKHGSVNM